MIGAVNGPDAADAVAWLERRAFTYLDARERLAVLRRTCDRRARRYTRANGRFPLWPLLSPAERREAARLRRVALNGRVQRGDGVYRPMFQFLRAVPARIGSDAARWPRPFSCHTLDDVDAATEVLDAVV